MNIATLTSALVFAAITGLPSTDASAPHISTQKTVAHADKMGLELDGVGDGSRSKPFVDVAKTVRPYTLIGKTDLAPTDSDGWPKADCQAVFFDIRPFPAWNPPIDDPEKFQPDWSGTYKLSLLGRAVVQTGEGNDTIANEKYDPRANTTTADVIVPSGSGLLILSFSNTQRTAESPAGSGFTQLRLIRPGYSADTKQVFTTEFLRALKPFAALRYMDLLDTNHNPGYYGDAGHHALEWKDRHLPTDATQQSTGDKYGLAWEYVVQLANETGKDAWINIPVAASYDYINHLAHFLKAGLNPHIRIYIEDSNEVWNFGFPQYIYNKLAAIDEVQNAHLSKLADGSPGK